MSGLHPHRRSQLVHQVRVLVERLGLSLIHHPPPSQKYFFCASRFFFSDPFPNPNPIAATQLAPPFGPRLPPRRSAKRFAFVLLVSQPLRLLRRHRPFAYAHSFGLWPHPAHLPRAVRPRYRVSARPPPWLIITQPTPPNTTPPHYPHNYYLPKPSARSLRRVAPRSPSPHTPSLTPSSSPTSSSQTSPSPSPSTHTSARNTSSPSHTSTPPQTPHRNPPPHTLASPSALPHTTPPTTVALSSSSHTPSRNTPSSSASHSPQTPSPPRLRFAQALHLCLTAEPPKPIPTILFASLIAFSLRLTTLATILTLYLLSSYPYSILFTRYSYTHNQTTAHATVARPAPPARPPLRGGTVGRACLGAPLPPRGRPAMPGRTPRAGACATARSDVDGYVMMMMVVNVVRMVCVDCVCMDDCVCGYVVSMVVDMVDGEPVGEPVCVDCVDTGKRVCETEKIWFWRLFPPPR